MAATSAKATPTAAEIAEARHVVLPVRIDDRIGARQLGARLVMVDDHRVHAELAGQQQRVVGHHAAIERDEKLHALGLERFDREPAWPVAFGDAVRDVDVGPAPHRFQETDDERHRRDAVDVVVADEADMLRAPDRRGEALGPPVEVAQLQRRRHELADRRVEMPARLVERDAAPGQHASQHLRQRMLLRDGERQPVVDQARLPGAPAQRARHVEKMASVRRGLRPRSSCGSGSTVSYPSPSA